jgi:hypothetical protein
MWPRKWCGTLASVQYTDDVDIRNVEVVSNRSGPTTSDSVEHFTIGHFAFYNNVGRTEVPPIPTDSEANGPDIRYDPHQLTMQAH